MQPRIDGNSQACGKALQATDRPLQLVRHPPGVGLQFAIRLFQFLLPPLAGHQRFAPAAGGARIAVPAAPRLRVRRSRCATATAHLGVSVALLLCTRSCPGPTGTARASPSALPGLPLPAAASPLGWGIQSRRSAGPSVMPLSWTGRPPLGLRDGCASQGSLRSRPTGGGRGSNAAAMCPRRLQNTRHETHTPSWWRDVDDERETPLTELFEAFFGHVPHQATQFDSPAAGSPCRAATG